MEQLAGKGFKEELEVEGRRENYEWEGVERARRIGSKMKSDGKKKETKKEIFKKGRLRFGTQIIPAQERVTV